MKKQLRLFRLGAVIAIILMMMISISTSAHSGGTDSKGGHYNHYTGEYHYHHGHPAHQHPDGVCPYGDYGTSSNATPENNLKSFKDRHPIINFFLGLSFVFLCVCAFFLFVEFIFTLLTGNGFEDKQARIMIGIISSTSFFVYVVSFFFF